MDRNSPVVDRNSPVILTVFNRPGRPLTGRVSEQFRNLMLVKLPEAIPVGAAMKLESDSSLYLGEVAACRPDGSGFAALLELDNALFNTRELAVRARRLFEGADR
jgi:hypothetical protein